MRTGRPRTPIGTHGSINTRRIRGRVIAETRVRDLDGRLRQVRATGPTAAAARSKLMERIRERPALPSAGSLRPTSSFADLADLWLADLEVRDLAGNTKENYRTCLRLHVRPAFEHYTLAEVTTGRVEWFLARQAKTSPSQARHTRTLLNMLFAYALRHDAVARNSVEGSSQLRRTKPTPKALMMEQITAIRQAAAAWRSEPGLPGPKPDGAVRDIIEVLAARDESNSRTRLRQAAFPVTKTLEDFDVAASSIPTPTFDYLASLEWVRAGENICLIGPAGTGKSHMLVALGIAAVQAGHRVRYFTAAELVETLYRGLADNSVGRVIETLLRNDVVLIDELGFAPLDDTGAQLLFRFVAAAYERRSIGIGSHWPFESWGRFLPEHTTAVSMLDRLLHHCHTVVTDGDSYRMKQARGRGGQNIKTS